MLELLFGSRNAELVLRYITARNEAYASEISKYYETDLSPIQKQLEKFENAGILYSRSVGRTRVYAFNPRYPFLKELKALLTKSIDFLRDIEKERLMLNRRRPRKKDKISNFA